MLAELMLLALLLLMQQQQAQTEMMANMLKAQHDAAQAVASNLK
jgi:hypothetical protein